MSTIKIALAISVGLIITSAAGVGGAFYVSDFAKTRGEDHTLCLSLQSYTEKLIRADLFGRKKPDAPDDLSLEDRTFVEENAGRVLADHKKDLANGRRDHPSSVLIERANLALCE